MTDSRKPSKVVPVHRGKTAATATATCQLAWIESDKCGQPESEREPFLSVARNDGSESSLECERLCDPRAAKKARIFSIDLERGSAAKKGLDDTPARAESTDSSTGSSPGTTRSNSSSSNDDSHSDAKLVDKLRKVNRRKRKQTRTAKLLQLCQCCPWAVPWSLLIVSALQVGRCFVFG